MKTSKIILIIVAVLLIAGGAYGTYFFYHQYQNLKTNPDLASQQETQIIIKKISQLMNLPTDEEPTIATITDKNQLSGQDFFKNCENGDKLIAYVNAKKAILYRPSTNKIIEVAPIYIDDSKNSDSNTSATPTPISTTATQ